MADIQVVLNNDLTLDKSWIKSIDSLSQSTGQPKNIYYGITPSSGTIEIIDREGQIQEWIESGALNTDNITVDIYANGKKVQSHKSTDSSYSLLNKVLRINLSNDLEGLSDKQYLGMKVQDTTQNAKAMLSSILTSLGYSSSDIATILGRNMVVSTYANNMINNTTMTVGDYLSGITIEYPYLEADNVNATLEKFCRLAQLNMYLSDDGTLPIFISARPVMSEDEDIIEIFPKQIIGNPNQDLIAKNKISSVDTMYQDTKYEYVNISNKTVTSYSIPVSYTNTASSYTNILGDTASNPDITVLYNQLQDYSSIADPGQYIHFFNAIIKYKVEYKVKSEIPRFQTENRYDYFNPEGSSTKIKSKAYNSFVPVGTSGRNWVYPSTASDSDVISSWLYNGYIAITNEDQLTKVRINDDDSIDVFIQFPQKTTNSSHTEMIACIKEDNFSILVKEISHSDVKQTNNAQVDIQSSELMQKNTKYGTENMYDIISNNILVDYAYGVRTFNASVVCGDYNYSDTSLAKNWADGDIIQVGDLVAFPPSTKVWRTTGRRFKYSGVPKIDLELQEVGEYSPVNTDMFVFTAIDANGNYEGTANYDGTPVAYMLGKWTGTSVSDQTVNNALNGEYFGIDVTAEYPSSEPVPDEIENLVIPGKYNGLPVTEINSHGFQGYIEVENAPDIYTIASRINTIKLGANIKTLNQSAFGNMSRSMNESTFIFNNVLESLQGGCLHEVFSSSANITLPSSINYIGSGITRGSGTTSYKINTLTIQGSFETPTGSSITLGESANYVIFTSTVGSISGRICGGLTTSGFKFVFEHGVNDNIELNISSPKSASTADIYTDNTIVRNYDWASKNITVTFHSLSEYTNPNSGVLA